MGKYSIPKYKVYFVIQFVYLHTYTLIVLYMAHVLASEIRFKLSLILLVKLS